MSVGGITPTIIPVDAFILFLITVYATMRNLSKGEALVEAAGRTLGRTLEIKQLDVCDEDSVKACVDSLPERRVDVLSKIPPPGSENFKVLRLYYHA